MYLNDKFGYIQPIKYSTGKCVVFDLDGCLITKANGSPGYEAETDPNNYVFLYNVENTINEFLNNNIQVIIISNQSNITDAKVQMMLNIWNHFSKRLLFLIAHKHNEFRKPNPAFLEIIKCDYEILFYCGDAIGKNSNFPPFQWGDADLNFALNGNVSFKDPLEVFGSNFYSIAPNQRLIIMMGNMGSGKSTISKRFETLGFIHMQQDNEGDLLAKFRINNVFDLISQGKQVIIDACNGGKSKEQWIIQAKQRNVPFVILWLPRCGRSFNALRETPVSSRAYPQYTKYFIRPQENYIIVS